MEQQSNRSIELCRRVVTTESFIAEAQKIYGDKYDYSKVDYKNRDHQVVVGCSIHGDFKIFAREHLDGKGCPKCAKGDKFLQKLKENFGDKFLLDNFIYESSTTPVKLICPTHGVFSRLPNSILSSKWGCPECGNEYSRQLQEQSHAEAEAKKLDAKKKKDEDNRAALQEWYKNWRSIIDHNYKFIELWPNDCWSFLSTVKDSFALNPLEAFKNIVDQYIELIRRGRKAQKELAELSPLSDEDACNLEDFRRGDTFYFIKNNKSLQPVFEYAESVYKADSKMVAYNLSHRGCHVSFLGNNLLIRLERPPFFSFIGGVTELFNELRSNGVDEWEGMKVYVCPFDDVVYVTEDIKMESARYADDNTKWFVIPFDDCCNENVIKYGRDEYFRLTYSYKLFKNLNESQFYDLVIVGEEYSYSDIAFEMGLAVSTIKTIVRTLERYDALVVTKYSDAFIVNKKNCKDFVKDCFLEDYKKMTEDILEYLRKPQSKYKLFTTNVSCSKAIKIENIPTSFVGIDFETLYSQRVSACSVGMVKYKDGQIVDRYYSLIRPPFDYPGKSGMALTWIHGFREEDFESERTFVDVLPEMETFADGLPLVAHNACVERACIQDTARYYGLSTTLDTAIIIDTYPLSKQVEQALGCEVCGRGTHSLDAVCRRFGIPEKNHHNALDDAEMCGNLLVAFRRALENIDVAIKPITTEVTITPKINPEDKIQRSDLENVQDNPFKDKVIVLTGFAKADSQQYAHQLNELGAIIKDTVNKKTNILITGYNAGPSKMKKAEEFGAQIIPEEEMKRIIESFFDV